MSTNSLILFPADPSFVPAIDAQERAAETLRNWVAPVYELTAQTEDRVQFIHGMADFSKVDRPLGALLTHLPT